MAALFTTLRMCSFCNVSLGRQDVKLRDLTLTDLLPDGYDHVLCSYNNVDENNFEATICLPIYTPDEFRAWKDAFEQNSMSTYRVKITYPNVGPKVLFKGRYHCHHKGCGKRSKGLLTTKATQCRSEMTLTLLNVSDKYRGKNPHIPEFPASVHIKWTHNHIVFGASALRYRDVGQAAQEKLIEFFNDGLSPACALDAFHKSLEDEPNYSTIMGDRHFVPDFFYVNRLFNKHFESLYGNFNGEVKFEDVLEHMKSLDIKSSSHTDGNDLIIAIVTPLVQRVHRLVPQSGEIAFMDAGSGMDRYGAQVMMLMTHTPLGGLPLGSILSTSLKAEHIEKGLSMLSGLLGKQAFYGRGKDGPSVFMTDHCEPERKAITAVFPSSTPLLCPFHILQAFWRFLCNLRPGVEKEDKPHILNLMKGLLYAANIAELEEKYSKICQSEVIALYPAIQEQFRKHWDIKDDWALALRHDMLVRGSNTNHLVKSCFRTFEDKILNRQKCFNVVQLLNYIALFVSKYFSRKLLQLIRISGAADASSASKQAQAKGADIAKEDVTHVDGDTFKVLTDYVDTSLGTCTCYFGSSGTACKHQFAIRHLFDAYYDASMPVLDEADKLRYIEVAIGERSVPDNCFDPLTSSQSLNSGRNATAVPQTVAKSELGEVDESDTSDIQKTQADDTVTSDHIYKKLKFKNFVANSEVCVLK